MYGIQFCGSAIRLLSLGDYVGSSNEAEGVTFYYLDDSGLFCLNCGSIVTVRTAVRTVTLPRSTVRPGRVTVGPGRVATHLTSGYAPHYATSERNHRLGTATGSLPVHEAPRFGRLRLPQLGAGVSVTAPLSLRTLAAASYYCSHYNLGT